jgi:hypothetical protein
VLLLAAGVGFSQTTQKEETLVVKGYSGQAPVLQVNGKSYVELETLARLTNGSLSFQSNQVTLTFASLAAKAAPTPQDPTVKLALSKDFLRAAIEELTVIREWRIAIVNAIQNNYPVTDDWVGGYGGMRRASSRWLPRQPPKIPIGISFHCSTTSSTT